MRDLQRTLAGKKQKIFSRLGAVSQAEHTEGAHYE